MPKQDIQLIKSTDDQETVDIKESFSGKGFSKLAKQEDTTNTNPVTDTIVLQYGWGSIQGDDTVDITESVTFPEEFGEAPIVICGVLGRHTSAPSAIGDFTTAQGNPWVASADDITTTGFTVTLVIETGATLPSTSYFGYTWLAIGKKL